MALGIFEYDAGNSEFNVVSEDGAQTNPVQSSHDGTNGEIVEKKLYLRNDNTNFYYENITLETRPARKVRVGDPNYPEAFIGFKVINQDIQPTESEWLAVESGNMEVFDNIGSETEGDTAYKPFWVQISFPAGIRVQTIIDVSLSLDRKESPVSP